VTDHECRDCSGHSMVGLVLLHWPILTDLILYLRESKERQNERRCSLTSHPLHLSLCRTKPLFGNWKLSTDRDRGTKSAYLWCYRDAGNSRAQMTLSATIEGYLDYSLLVGHVSKHSRHDAEGWSAISRPESHQIIGIHKIDKNCWLKRTVIWSTQL